MGVWRQWQAERRAMLSVRQLGTVEASRHFQCEGEKGTEKLLQWYRGLWHNANYF